MYGEFLSRSRANYIIDRLASGRERSRVYFSHIIFPLG